MECPLCARSMRIRTGRYGEFWTCSGYPICRATRPISRSRRSTNARARKATPRRNYASRTTLPGLSAASPSPEPIAQPASRWSAVGLDYCHRNRHPSRIVRARRRDRQLGFRRRRGPRWTEYNGYAVTCRDGWISHSGGVQGACSARDPPLVLGLGSPRPGAPRPDVRSPVPTGRARGTGAAAGRLVTIRRDPQRAGARLPGEVGLSTSYGVVVMRVCEVARRASVPWALGLSVAIVSHAVQPHTWPPIAHIEHAAGPVSITNILPPWSYGSNRAVAVAEPYDWT
jgi:hypothetical protein